MEQWPENVNSRFYGLDGETEENRKEIKFKSGRRIYHRINSSAKKRYALKLWLEDTIKTNGLTEFGRFMEWYDTINGSGSVPITLPAIEDSSVMKEYYVYMTNWNGQKNKELSLTLEEV